MPNRTATPIHPTVSADSTALQTIDRSPESLSNYSVKNQLPLKALLISTREPNQTIIQQDQLLDELQSLAAELGYESVDRVVQQRAALHPSTVFGSGKVQQMRERISQYNANCAIYDGLLAPGQARRLETLLMVPVIDRTQLILDIFAKHATTKRAQTQVELARLQYLLPRVNGMWAHLDRERGGIGSSKGTGEKQLSIDKNLIHTRISRLKKALKQIETERHTQNKQASRMMRVVLVGYTNAGKSTLMKQLTQAQVKIANQLFATLDPTVRLLHNTPLMQITLTDTVGFIRHLPHQLVSSFHSTLAMVREADLLLHVVDLSHVAYEECIHTVNSVLAELDASHVPQQMVFNKIDQTSPWVRLSLAKAYPNARMISAVEHNQCQDIRGDVLDFFSQNLQTAELHLPYPHGASLLNRAYRLGEVSEIDYQASGISCRLTATAVKMKRFEKMLHDTSANAH